MKAEFKYPSFWYHWLLWVASGAMALAVSMIVMPRLVIKFFNSIFFSNSDVVVSEAAQAYLEYAQSILGAVMFGWSILLLLIIIGPFRNGNIDGWNYLLVAIIAWFVPDTIFSVIKGFWENAIMYSLLTFFLIVPLIATYNAFRINNK